MNFFLHKILLAVFSCLLFTGVYAQINISQEISPEQINKDQYATLRILIQNGTDIRHVTPPSLKNFMVLSGPNQESGMSSVNGHVTQFVALSFILKPTQIGKIDIEPTTVNVGGKLYKTNKAALVVKNATSPNGSANSITGSLFPRVDPFAEEKAPADFSDYVLHKGENVTDKVNKNMQLRLETDKTSCFVGEPIVASYKLYTRLKSESKLTENPSFNGFSVVDLTGNSITGYTRQKLGGREYNVYTIRKAQLYPLQPGNIDLESAELENNIQFIKDDYAKRNNGLNGLFDDFTDATLPGEGLVNETVSLKSKPVTILVKPLPDAGKPASFAGAVGAFSIESSLQKDNFPANEAGKLIVRINGSGNLQLVTAPGLQWPSGIDPFDPKFSEDLDKNTIPVSGSKTFEYNFSANAPGNYTLPSISFSYFDPKTAVYKTIVTKEIPFTVTKSTGPAKFVSATNNKQEVSGINKIFTHRWWIIVFIAVVMLVGLIIWIRKDKKAAKEQLIIQTKKEEEVKDDTIIEALTIAQQNPLEKTEECLYKDDCYEFYMILNTELKNFLSRKFLVNSSLVNTKSIAAVLDKKNIDNRIALQLQRLLQEIEWQLYTPFERNEKMNELYHSAQDIIQQVNAYDIRHQ